MKINSSANILATQKTSFKGQPPIKDWLPESLLPTIQKDAFECYGIEKNHSADGMGIGIDLQKALQNKGFSQDQRAQIMECVTDAVTPRLTILNHILEKVKHNVEGMGTAIANTTKNIKNGHYDK